MIIFLKKDNVFGSTWLHVLVLKKSKIVHWVKSNIAV